VPDVVVADPERFISPSHARLDVERGSWVLADTSLNGTFVGPPDGLRYVLSERGVERQRDAGQALPDPDPPASVPLSDGARVQPVDPKYGPELVFRES
jgi:pSer/pThr/pTyr-binding forkhead associated (FHA) protein